jgi:hypothetical protein
MEAPAQLQLHGVETELGTRVAGHDLERLPGSFAVLGGPQVLGQEAVELLPGLGGELRLGHRAGREVHDAVLVDDRPDRAIDQVVDLVAREEVDGFPAPPEQRPTGTRVGPGECAADIDHPAPASRSRIVFATRGWASNGCSFRKEGHQELKHAMARQPSPNFHPGVSRTRPCRDRSNPKL